METALDLYARLTPIFQDVFDRDDVAPTPEMTAQDVDEWDSLSHIRLIVAIEQALDIQFSVGELNKLKNVSEMVAVIQAKLG